LTKKSFKKSFAKDLATLIKKDMSLVDSFILDKAGKKEVITDVAKNDTRLSQEAFRLADNEYGFYINNDKGYLVLLTQVKGRYLPDCESIKDVVKNDLYEDRAEKNLVATMNAIKDGVQGEDLAVITNKYGLKWQKTGFVLPSDYQKVQKLEKEGLPMNEVISWEKVGSLITTTFDKGGVVIKLDEIKNYDLNDFIAFKDEVTNKSEGVSKRLFIESFVASLYRNATIETNESIIIQD
jgi:hypothetical protein